VVESQAYAQTLQWNPRLITGKKNEEVRAMAFVLQPECSHVIAAVLDVQSQQVVQTHVQAPVDQFSLAAFEINVCIGLTSASVVHPELHMQAHHLTSGIVTFLAKRASKLHQHNKQAQCLTK